MFPSDSLVAFAAKRLARASVMFANPSFDGPHDWLSDYAYVIPSVLETPDQLRDESKIFFAERYGGKGVVHHGGGVRCGFDGKFQVKGIGRNLLAGEGTDETKFWHSHGGLALVDAIQEAIWGEVFYHALPHRAARVPAIILTGTQCWLEGAHGKRTKAPRALVVREAALRPAHFERAVFFRPENAAQFTPDTDRVRTAISFLPEALPMSHEVTTETENRLDKIARLNLGMVEMARRFAAQCAVAQSKRLMHGAITASNICLDGRWIDYGTASAMPNYANTKNFGLPPYLPTLWQEQDGCVEILRNMCFYIGKYFAADNKTALPQFGQLLKIFQASYQNALIRAFARLTGFPNLLLDPHLSSPPVSKLSGTLIRIARAGVERPFVPAIVDLKKFGSNRLGLILLTLARWNDHAECDIRLAACLEDERTRAEVIAAYRAVADLMYQEAGLHGIDRDTLRKLCVLNAAKTAKEIPDLYRHRMALQSQNLIDDHASLDDLSQAIQSWIASLSDLVQVLYQDTRGLTTLAWKSGSVSIHFDAVHDRWNIHNGEQASHLPSSAVHHSPIFAAMKRYWGSGVLDVWR